MSEPTCSTWTLTEGIKIFTLWTQHSMATLATSSTTGLRQNYPQSHSTCESRSCDPNLNIFNVYVDCLDPDMPRLCLFAKREIKRGEQISFDYRQSTGNTDSKNTIKGRPITGWHFTNRYIKESTFWIFCNLICRQLMQTSSPLQQKRLLFLKRYCLLKSTAIKSITVYLQWVFSISHCTQAGVALPEESVCRCGAPNCRKILF